LSRFPLGIDIANVTTTGWSHSIPQRYIAGMTTPPYQPGPYGQPNQDPWGQQSGGGHGQYGPRQPEQPGQPQFGGQWGTEQTQQITPNPQGGPTQQFGPGQQAAAQQAGPTQQFGPAQQFGQQPQFGQTQQWPGAGGPQFGGGFQPPEPPPQKKTGMIVAIVVVAVLVIAGAGVGIYLATKDNGTNNAGGETTTSETTTDSSGEETTSEEETTTTEEGGGDAVDAQPGDCIKVNVASSTNADIETIDCSTPEAVYKVATREENSTGSCPNDQYVSYTEEGQLLLCLQLNVRDGECLQITDTEDKRADCAAPEATHRVVKVLDGVDDETQCDDATTEVITYPQPPLTICLASPAS
jgi:hypothetical protein